MCLKLGSWHGLHHALTPCTRSALCGAAPHGGIMHEHDGMSMQRCLHHMAYTKV